MTDNSVKWESPKTLITEAVFSSTRLAQYREILMAELKSQPGRWARVADYASRNTAKTAKRRFKAKFPEHEFRVETQNGRGVVFARYPDPTCADSKDVI